MKNGGKKVQFMPKCVRYSALISVSTKQNTMIFSVVGRVALTLRSELVLNELMNSKLIYYCCIQYFNTSISQKFNLQCSAECCAMLYCCDTR